MPVFIFVIGVRGAGKTTLINNYGKQTPAIPVLRPSTTRAKRNESDTEYDFVEHWDEEDYLWTIEVNSHKYGVHRKEIARLETNEPCLCVFDPGAISTINGLRDQYPGRVITVGIDTITSTKAQHDRVKNAPTRVMERTAFIEQMETVHASDVVLSGDEKTLLNGLNAVIDCINGKGGVLVRRQIEPLLRANTLLERADTPPSTASYDLCLGDDVWCQGSFITLSKKQPTLKIPPYTYAIVSCKERAKLPSFVTARFDLKNSLFFRGVILSNGPQVDPGYHGALFCMLYNSSDSVIGITRGDQFSTIEFHRTCGLSDGYADKYQNKSNLSDFIPSDAAVSKGGMILERTEDKIKELSKEWGRHKAFTVLSISIFITILSILIPIILSQYDEGFDDIDAKRAELEEKINSIESLETKLNLLINLEKLDGQSGNNSDKK